MPDDDGAWVHALRSFGNTVKEGLKPCEQQYGLLLFLPTRSHITLFQQTR